MVKVIKYVDKCDECPYQTDGLEELAHGVYNNIPKECSILKIETVEGFILDDCPKVGRTKRK